MTSRLPLAVLGLLMIACGSSDDGTTGTTGDAGPSDTGLPDSNPADTGPSDTAIDDVATESSPDSADDADAADLDADLDAADQLERRTFSGPEGLRDYLLFRPTGAGTKDLPLVVVLHGCNQSAEGFVELTGFNELAESESFYTVWPEQSGTANPYLCWNWFLDENQKRDSGEAALLAAIVDEVIDDGGIDTKRVHAVGLSAGGAMSVVLGTVFPEKFASIGSVEGCPFKGTPCLNAPSSLSGDELATIAHSSMGANARALPVFVVQGDADTNVPPANGDLLVEQWLGVADLVDNGALDQSISRQPTTTSNETASGGKTYEVLSYDGENGELVRRWTVNGLTHAWPGGAAGMAFSDPGGPDAAEGAWAFFAEHPMP